MGVLLIVVHIIKDMGIELPCKPHLLLVFCFKSNKKLMDKITKLFQLSLNIYQFQAQNHKCLALWLNVDAEHSLLYLVD